MLRSPVLAFLKRRWMLLSFALACLAASMVDAPTSPLDPKGGYFHLFKPRVTNCYPTNRPKAPFTFHEPKFGGLPHDKDGFGIPIWAVLMGVIGWIAIGELRVREDLTDDLEADPE